MSFAQVAYRQLFGDRHHSIAPIILRLSTPVHPKGLPSLPYFRHINAGPVILRWKDKLDETPIS
jgi:hypothetical protein